MAKYSLISSKVDTDLALKDTDIEVDASAVMKNKLPSKVLENITSQLIYIGLISPSSKITDHSISDYWRDTNDRLDIYLSDGAVFVYQLDTQANGNQKEKINAIKKVLGKRTNTLTAIGTPDRLGIREWNLEPAEPVWLEMFGNDERPTHD